MKGVRLTFCAFIFALISVPAFADDVVVSGPHEYVGLRNIYETVQFSADTEITDYYVNVYLGGVDNNYPSPLLYSMLINGTSVFTPSIAQGYPSGTHPYRIPISLNSTNELFFRFHGNGQIGIAYEILYEIANRLPVISSTPATQVTEGVQYSYQIIAADHDELNTLTYALESGPSGMAVNAETGLVLWTPTAADVGFHDISVSATDPEDGVKVQNFQLEVVASVPPFVFTDADELTVIVGARLEHQITVESDQFYVLNIMSGPAGVSIDPTTEILSWLPITPGQYFIEVAVANSIYGVTKTYTVNVLPLESTHEGKDFWLTFPYNVTDPDLILRLFISSDVDTTGVVEAPLEGLSIPFSVTAGQVTTVDVPNHLQGPDVNGDFVENNGLRVTSQDNVTIYGINHVPASTDGFLALPTNALGLEYRVLAYGKFEQTVVLATQDNTEVTVTIAESGMRIDGQVYNEGDTFTVTLNAGQTANFEDGNTPELSGSLIQSDKPVAVFSGATCTNVPQAKSACDHLVEQLTPVSSWGDTYYSVPFAGRINGDIFRVVAAFDDTDVTINGEYLLTLQAGDWLDDTLDVASVISANHPIQVAQFSQGASADSGTKGDPLMILLTPANQALSSYTFITTDLDITENSVNVIIEQSWLATLQLNGQPVDTSGFEQILDTPFYGGSFTLAQGIYTLSADAGFLVDLYGFGDFFNSYGYAVGQSLPVYDADDLIAVTPSSLTPSVGEQLCLDMVVGDGAVGVLNARVDVFVPNANQQQHHVNTDQAGVASFCYYGLAAGQETLSISSGPLTQNVVIDWQARNGDGQSTPVIVSTPRLSAQIGKPYQNAITALDADANDPLSMTLTTGPAGMSLQNGVLEWTPTGADLGQHLVTVEVTDSTNRSVQQTYSLLVYLGNQPPVIEDLQDRYIAYIGKPSVGFVTASDPDDRTFYCQIVDSPIYPFRNNRVYTTTNTPDINDCNDFIFSPPIFSADLIGEHDVTVRLWDRAGGETYYTFVIEVRQNTLPEVTTHPAQHAKVGIPYVSELVFTDPDGDDITYRLNSKDMEDGRVSSLPIVIDEDTGAITFEATDQHIGKHIIQVNIRDVVDTVFYQFPITVSLPDEPLVATLDISPQYVNVGEPVTLTASATGGVGRVGYVLTVNDVPLDVAIDGTATFTDTVASGVYAVRLIATDEVDNRYEITNFIAVRIDEDDGGSGGGGGGGDPADPDAPALAFTNLVGEERLTTPTDIAVSVNDANLTVWRLGVRQENGEFELATGNTNVDAVVASLDPSLLVNGQVELVLYAEDINGQATELAIPVLIDGDLKVGNFTYTVEEVSIPMVGLPITINRTYDSRLKHVLGDFGYGWFLDYNLVDLDVSRPLGAGWRQVIEPGTGPVPIPTYCIKSLGDLTVSVRLPDDEVETFRAKVSPECSFAAPTLEVNVEFEATGDTTSTLALANPIQVRYTDGNLVIPGQENPFDATDFVLTTRAGYEYQLSKTEGLSMITDPNGNTLTFDENGVHHSAGKSVVFFRNQTNGLIANIRRPDGTNSQRVHGFTYDAALRLTKRAIDSNRAVEAYEYDFKNSLTNIADGENRTKVLNIYDDDGRLIAQEDTDGNRTNFNHNIAGRQSTVTDRNGNITFYFYNDEGNVTSMVDALGNTTSYTYDDKGNELTMTDPLGHVTTKTYNEFNEVLTLTDPEGNLTRYTYNDLGAELTITDANGNTYTNTYDGVGNLLTVTDPEGNLAGNNIGVNGLVTLTQDLLGHSTTFDYDTNGNKITKTDPLGTITTFDYDSANRQTLSSVPRTVGDSTTVNDELRYTYDRMNNVSQEQDNIGNLATFTYDNATNQLASEWRTGITTQYDRDTYNRVIEQRMTGPSGPLVTTRFTYDPEGNKLSETDPNGNTTTFAYDKLNRLITTTYADGSISSIEYDQAGRMTSETDRNNNTTTYGYDKAGRRTSITDALNNITTFEYDGNGNVVKQTDALGRITIHEYDKLDRRVKTTFVDTTTTQQGYDAMGRNTSQTDQTGISTQFTYDALGRLTRVTDALGQETTYTYDEVGNKLSQTDAEGRTTSWTYDSRGRVTSRTLPLGQTESFVYNSIDDISTHTDFNGNTTTYRYFSAHSVRQIIYANSRTELFTYDNNGNRLTARNTDSKTWFYTYDNMDRLISETQPDGTVLSYGYDNMGNKTSLTVTYANADTRSESYAYDALNRLISVTDNDNQTTTFDYDAVGNQTHIRYPNGLVAEYTFDDLNRVTAVTTKDANDNIVSQYSYALDATGRRETLTEHSGRVSNYTYDDLYRLTGETITDMVNGDYTASYIYDGVGNRTQSIINGITTAYSYDDNDRLLSQGAFTYTYDDQGNQLTESDGVITNTFTYDIKHQMTGTSDGTNVLAFAYNPDGIRTSKTVNGATTDFVVDSQRDYAQVIAEQDALQTINKEFVFGTDLVSQIVGGESHFFHYDSLGTTRDLSDSTGILTDSYFYEAFGELLASTGTTDNNYRYTGEQYDHDLDTYYLRARYYNPGVGRFTQMDTWLGNDSSPITLNKYVYGNADGVNNIDPTGNFSIAELQAVNNIRSILSETQIDIGTSLLDVALDPGKASNNSTGNALALGLGVIGGQASFKLLRMLSGKFRQACNSFTAGTLVSTEHGLVPIEDIKIGDKVWSFNEETGDTSLQAVIHLISGEGEKEIVQIKLNNGETIEATAGHPFYTMTSGGSWDWQYAGELTSDSMLFTTTDAVDIKSVFVEYEQLPVYNLTVANDHTYYVGESSVLAHNAGKCQFPKINWEKVLSGEFKKGKFRGFHHAAGGVLPAGRFISDKKLGPGGFYSAKVSAVNSVGNVKFKAQRSTFFPDNWPESKVRSIINSVIIRTKGRGGQIAVRDLVPENIPGVYIKVTVSGNQVTQAFPVIR